MSERKSWSQRQDQILKQLKQKRNISKWSQISHIMKSQFQILDRNGKQCRERYHNHLDSRITKTKWEKQQQNKLLNLHNLWGNRWAAISRQLPGRTDNCVKNHFYSYFRKCIKNINFMIFSFCKRKIRPIKLTIITKIVSIIEEYAKQSQMYDKTLYDHAKNLKCQILSFGEGEAVISQKIVQNLQNLSQKIVEFNKVSRTKLLKKKKDKNLHEQSSDYSNVHKQNQRIQKKSVKNKKKYIKAYQQLIKDDQVKIEDQQNLVKAQQIQNQVKTNNLLVEQTPIKQKNVQKEKGSSYYIINSVDYLDLKNNINHDHRDLIFMDDEKQWKLYFQ